MRRRWLALAAGAPVVVGTSGLVVAALFAGSSTTTSLEQGSSGASSCTARIEGGGRITELDRDQLENARVIMQVGSSMGVPRRGIEIALATAMQESQLKNLDYGDRDSVGLFQQRPSSGWGTISQLTDPPTSARKFYDALLKVRDWQAMALTVAAQTVQRSAFPNAYAQWEPLAVALVGAAEIQCSQTVGFDLPAGDVGTMLRVAVGQQGDPYVWGAVGPNAFDCSGLIVYAWQQAGYVLTIRTADQMYKNSQQVPPGSEQAGDLLFGSFNQRVAGGPGHVMLVVRPGWVVEAPRAGKDVRVRRYDAHAPGITFGRLNPDVLKKAT